VNDVSHEHRLLFACSNCARADVERSQLVKCPRIDWTRVSRAAETHFMLPLVMFHLQQAGAGLPPSLIQRAADAAAYAASHNLMLLTRLTKVLDLLGTQRIPSVTWKGPVFAMTGYGSLSLRNCSDLDILIPARHMEDARRVLPASGLALKPAAGWLPPGMRREFQFETPEGVWLEAHTSVAIWPLAITLPTEDLIARAVAVNVAGRTVRTLCADDMLLAVAAHGAGHGWSRLRLVSDIDACVRMGIDWPTVVTRSRTARMRRTLDIALLLAHDVLRTPVPADVVAGARRDRTAAMLARYIATTLDPQSHPRYRDWLGFASRDGLADRARYAVRELFLRQVVRRQDRAASRREVHTSVAR
jgi:hypothetical protein